MLAHLGEAERHALDERALGDLLELGRHLRVGRVADPLMLRLLPVLNRAVA